MEDTQKKDSFYSKLQNGVKAKMSGVDESKRKMYFVIIAVCGFLLLFLSVLPNTCSRKCKTDGKSRAEQVAEEGEESLPSDSIVDDFRFTN